MDRFSILPHSNNPLFEKRAECIRGNVFPFKPGRWSLIALGRLSVGEIELVGSRAYFFMCEKVFILDPFECAGVFRSPLMPDIIGTSDLIYEWVMISPSLVMVGKVASRRVVSSCSIEMFCWRWGRSARPAFFRDVRIVLWLGGWFISS